MERKQARALGQAFPARGFEGGRKAPMTPAQKAAVEGRRIREQHDIQNPERTVDQVVAELELAAKYNILGVDPSMYGVKPLPEKSKSLTE